jgi:hypothetical protein
MNQTTSVPGDGSTVPPRTPPEPTISKTARAGKPRRSHSDVAIASPELTYFNPAQVAEMWGVSHDKVLEFIKSGELRAFNVASKTSRRPQFKIPSAALREFEERRSGRDPARSLLPPCRRRSSEKSSASPTRGYF